MIAVSNYNVWADVEAELARARTKFPNSSDCFPALVEEIGELAKALLEMKQEPHKGVTHVDVYKEAVQCVCMAIRIATEGDPNFPYHPESGYRGVGWEGYVAEPRVRA